MTTDKDKAQDEGKARRAGIEKSMAENRGADMTQDMGEIRDTGSRRGARIAGSVLILVAVLVLGAWYFARHLDDFKKITEISPGSFTVLSALCILAIWINGLMLNAVVAIFETRVSLWEGFGLSAVNTMANFYFTKAGIAVKALYLKKRHGFPYSHYMSCLAGGMVIALMSHGVVGTVSYIWLIRTGDFRIEILLAFFGIVLAGMIPFLFPRLRLSPRIPLSKKIQRVIDGWQHMRGHRNTLVVIAVLNSVYVTVGALRLFIAYRGLGYDVGFLQCLVISPLSTLVVLVGVTPGSVGIRQALVGYTSKLLDLGMTEGVVASTVDHAVGTLWVLVIGFVFSNWVWGSRYFSRKTSGVEGGK